MNRRTGGFLDHLSELLEGQLEAAAVVGGAVGGDVLHRLLQHPLVAHVGLHQVLEAGGVLGHGVELGRGEREGGMKGEAEGRHLHIFEGKYVASCLQGAPETYMDVKVSKKDSHFKGKANLNDTSWLCSCMKNQVNQICTDRRELQGRREGLAGEQVE